MSRLQDTLIAIIMATYPVLLGLSSWAILELIEHDKNLAILNRRLEYVETGQYTRQNALEDRELLNARIESISREQNTADAYLKMINERLERMDEKITNYMENPR